MPRHPHEPPTGMVETALAGSRFSPTQVAALLALGIAPLLVVGGIATAAFGVTTQTAIPAAFLVIAAPLLVFSFSYVAMAARVHNQGGFVALVSRGLSRPLGVAAGAVSVLAYALLTFGTYGGFGDGARTSTKNWLHIDMAWYWYAFGAWALCGLFGLLRVTLTGRIAIFLGSAEILVVVALCAAGLRHPAAGSHVSFAALNPKALLVVAGSLGALWATVGLGNVGFELAPVFTEDARRRGRTIAMATFVVLVVSAVLYAGASWAMVVHHGADNIAVVAAAQGPGALFSMGSPMLADAGQVLYLSSLFGAMLTFHNATVRYLVTLARDGVLPQGLAHRNTRGAFPVASLAVSAAGLVVIWAYLAQGLNPLTQMLFWLGATGGLGVLILLAVTAVAMVAFFARNRFADVGLLRAYVCPVLAALSLGFIVAQIVHNFPLVLGPAANAFAQQMPWLFAITAVVGLVLAGMTYLRDEGRYVAIGQDDTAGSPIPVTPTRDGEYV